MASPTRPRSGELTLRCTACGAAGRPLIRGGSEGALDLCCRFCGTRAQLPIEQSGADFHDEAGCPKCGAPRAETACPRCGLIYERWQGRTEPEVTVPSDTEELWKEIAAHFFEPRRHETFLAHCLHAGALGYAAARYGEEETSPDRDRASIAEVRRRQVRAIAEATHLASLPEGEAKRSAGATRKVTLLTGAVVLVGLFVWMGWMLSAGTRTVRPAQAAHPAGASSP
jgi:hypothetical protein